MASLLISCPECGFRTLTTHAECIHCGAQLPEAPTPPPEPPEAEAEVEEAPPPPAEEAPPPEAAPMAAEEREAPKLPPRVSSASPDAPIDAERSTRRPLHRAEVPRKPADTVWPPRMKQQFTRKPVSAPKPPGLSEAGRLQAHLRGRCPRGHGALTPALLGDRSAQHCPQCNGLWLEKAEFAAFVRTLAQQTLDLEPSDAPRPLPAPVPGARQLPCPDCTAPLSLIEFAGLEGFPLAHCPKHGLWLEDDDLRAIMRRIATATRDEARRLASPPRDGARP